MNRYGWALSTVLLGGWLPGFSQVILESTRQVQAAQAILSSPLAPNTLSCRVEPLTAALNFALRYQAGYRTSVPLAQLPQSGAVLVAVFRVRVKGSTEGTYFRQIYRLPEIPPKTKLSAVLGGGFFLGTGDYEVDWLLSDNSGRECRSRWRIEHKPKQSEQLDRTPLGPGQVASLRFTSWKPRTDSRPYRLAVLLHVAPVWPRATILSPFDESIFITSLTSLFEHTPFQESSIVAFNIQKQRELFRTEAITNNGLQQLMDVMDELQFGTVDVREMNEPGRYLKFLAGMVNRELGSEPPPDAIVFVGPHTRYDRKFPSELLEAVPRDGRPEFFYLRYSYLLRFVPFADSVEQLVKGAGGKVFNITSPKDFISALRKMEERLAEKRTVEAQK